MVLHNAITGTGEDSYRLHPIQVGLSVKIPKPNRFLFSTFPESMSGWK